jgi:hypothetical protein
MPIEIPRTREGILALYEEVKPELQAFLADRVAGRNIEGMARARELDIALKESKVNPKVTSPIREYMVNEIKSLRDSNGKESYVCSSELRAELKDITYHLTVQPKVAALRSALFLYSGYDKKDIESKPVHGANLGGMLLRLARGVTKHIPVAGDVVRSVDGFSSDSLKEVLDLYNREILHYRSFNENIQERAQVASEAKIATAKGVASSVLFEGADSLESPRSIDAGVPEAVVSAVGSASPKMSQDEAATTIQAAYRGYNARNHFDPPVKGAVAGSGEPEAVFVPAAVKKTRQYNEIKALQTQFNTNVKTGNHKLLRSTVDLLIKADPANTPKFIQSCIDKKLGGSDFAVHLTKELHHATTAISAIKDRAKIDARAKKSMGR